MKRELIAILSALPFVASAFGQQPTEKLEVLSKLATVAIPATDQSPAAAPVTDCTTPTGCDPCCRRPRLYTRAEYILQWFENQTVPPLVVIAPQGSGFGQVGGVPGQFVLFGGGDVDFGGIDGMRVTAGYWLDKQQQWGIEASGLLTEQTAELFAAFHNGAANNPVLLARTDGTLAITSGIGVPGFQRGGVTVANQTRMWTAEGNIVRNWTDHSRWRTDVFAGFRYLDLDESLDIHDTTESLLAPGNFTRHSDVYDSRTQFYGGQVGSRVAAAWGRASLALVGKLGMGVSHLAVDRAGLTETQVAPGNVFSVPLGTLPMIPGRDTTNRFALLSETTIQVGYHWTNWLETTVGYNLIYLTSSARVGDQVRPGAGINATDFYANGITFGVSCRY